MVFRGIHGSEIVPLVLDLALLCHGKTDALKYFGNAVQGNRNRVSGSIVQGDSRRSEVYAVGLFLQGRLGQTFLQGLEFLFGTLFDLVDQLSEGLFLIIGHVFDFRKQAFQDIFGTEEADAKSFQFGGIAHGVGLDVLLYGPELIKNFC